MTNKSTLTNRSFSFQICVLVKEFPLEKRTKVQKRFKFLGPLGGFINIFLTTKAKTLQIISYI